MNIEFIITPKIELVLKASIDILICDINSNVMLSVIGNFEPSKNGKVKPAVLIQNTSELVNSLEENILKKSPTFEMSRLILLIGS